MHSISNECGRLIRAYLCITHCFEHCCAVIESAEQGIPPLSVILIIHSGAVVRHVGLISILHVPQCQSALPCNILRSLTGLHTSDSLPHLALAEHAEVVALPQVAQHVEQALPCRQSFPGRWLYISRVCCTVLLAICWRGRWWLWRPQIVPRQTSFLVESLNDLLSNSILFTSQNRTPHGIRKCPCRQPASVHLAGLVNVALRLSYSVRRPLGLQECRLGFLVQPCLLDACTANAIACCGRGILAATTAITHKRFASGNYMMVIAGGSSSAPRSACCALAVSLCRFLASSTPRPAREDFKSTSTGATRPPPPAPMP